MLELSSSANWNKLLENFWVMSDSKNDERATKYRSEVLGGAARREIENPHLPLEQIDMLPVGQ